ncbi:MAG: dihydrolipoamide acetyltransferase family protein [Anaerolineaceae bacterium]|jgi:pyruvate dehydrogenase E2 component (dihydrolipoamide acetyltransferase)
MADIVTMPKLGFDMAEGTLVRWVRQEGETVEKGAVLAEIETDKATVEVESNFSGVVYKQLVTKGTIVPVGTPIAVIAAAGEKVDVGSLNLGAVPAGAQAPAGVQAPAPEKVMTKEAVKPVAVPAAVVTPVVVETAPIGAGTGMVKASPLARKLAVDAGLDLRGLRGTGPGGRIVRKDVEGALGQRKAAPEASLHGKPVPAVAAAAQVLQWAPGPVPEDQRIPLDRLRGAIGRRMADAKQRIPHFYITHTYDVEMLLSLRTQANALVSDEKKLSVNDFVVKAAALTLRQFPNLNASLDGDNIVRHGHINLGVAVSVPGGLMTVVCKDADQKPLSLISAEVKEMAARARQGKVRPQDVDGSTFSISNLGMYDVEDFAAIINPPEAAILAVGTAHKVPVVAGDALKVGMRMKATISADHRITDGVEAAQFMQALGGYLENPLGLLMG